MNQLSLLTMAFYGVRKGEHGSKLHLVVITRDRQQGGATQIFGVNLTANTHFGYYIRGIPTK